MAFIDQLEQLTYEQREQLLKRASLDGEQYRLYGLSPGQKRMWFLYQADPDGLDYLSLYQVSIEGEISRERLERTFYQLIRKHRMLRTIYPSINGIPFQTWEDTFSFTIPLKVVEADGDINNNEILHNERIPFRLEKEIPIRAVLYKMGSGSYKLLICMHHIAHDGWSIGIMMQDFYRYYRSETLSLPAEEEAEVTYIDYCRALKQDGISDKTFWNEYLSGAKGALLFQRIESENAEKGGNVSIELSGILFEELKEFCKNRRISAFQFFVGIFAIALRAFTGQSDLVFGVPVLNRKEERYLSVIGYFSNTVPLRMQVESEQTYLEYAQKIEIDLNAVLEHERVPLDEILRSSNQEYGGQLFNIMFSVQDARLMNGIAGKAVEMEGSKFRFSTFRNQERYSNEFPMVQSIIEEPDRYVAGIAYQGQFFQRSQISSLLLAHEKIIRKILDDPEIKLGTLLNLFSQNIFVLREQEVRAGEADSCDDQTIEEKVAAVWKRMMPAGETDPNLSYLEAGGTSFSSIRTLEELNREFGLSMTIADFFANSTIKKLSRYIASQQDDGSEPPEGPDLLMF